MPLKHQDMLHILKQNTFNHFISSPLKALDRFKENIPNIHFFHDKSPIYYILQQINDFLIRISFLDVHPYDYDLIKEHFESLNNNHQTSVQAFKSTLSHLLEHIQRVYKQEIRVKLSKLTCKECERLDEAITAYNNYCYNAAVILTVSAIESRLHYLIKTRYKKLYKKYFESATLGKLIAVFDENQYKDKEYLPIKKLLPREHKPLIEFLNIYRIYSVHPKEKTIGQKIAQSIINLSVLLLLDDRLKIREKNLLKHT